MYTPLLNSSSIPELAGGVGGHMMRQEVEFMILDGW